MHSRISIITGGAERQVVDAALGLQQRNYDAEIFTSHHSPSHCFEETRDGPSVYIHSDLILICCPICCPGTLNVTCSLPILSLRGLFHILFAHFRQLYLVLHLPFVILSTNSSRLFRLSGCSTIAVWSSTATSRTNCWQMENTRVPE